MKLFFCQSLETSDDEEEEAGEEEQSEKSSEDDDGKYAADSEEDMSSDGGDKNGSEDKLVSGSSRKAKIEKNNVEDSISSLRGKPNKADESENDSDASVSTDEDISLKSVTGKQDIKGGKEGVQVKKSKSNAPTLSSKTKPARSKNVNTEMMVVAAIRNLNERGGSSVLAINKYIMNNYPQLDGPRTLRLIKKYIKTAITNGRLVQAKGSGLGGSFKMSAEMNRQEERKNRKKLKQKAKKDAPAKKADKKPKTIKKKAENSESKPATVKNTTKTTKATKPVVQLDNADEPTAKLPKVSATAKKMAKATDSKNSNKTPTKDAKPSTIAKNQPLEKPKVTTQSKSAKGIATSTMNSTADKEVKGSHKKSASAPPIAAISSSSPKAMSKGKAAAMPKKKPLAKGKASASEVSENGASDADTVKPAKKLAGKKTKTK